jgi:hypothetical protein
MARLLASEHAGIGQSAEGRRRQTHEELVAIFVLLTHWEDRERPP